jgi:hypothetical protein
MRLSWSVTAATCVSALQTILAPVSTVIDCETSRLPLKTVVVPSVAELPTAKNTLAALAPLVRSTRRPGVITNVDVIWKMNTAFAFPPPSSVRSPDETASEDAAL